MSAYYNEIEPYAAQWLRNLIKAGHIADGEVDTRSIIDVRPSDLAGFTQCHFFAGIGGWSYAARLARWPDERPLWTGSAPCQPFSTAGKQKGTEDKRHLWPAFFRLIRACRPPIVMGEQVAAAVGKDWLDGVCSDLESVGYACGAAVVPACAVDSPHQRNRLWFVADATRELPHWSRGEGNGWSKLANNDGKTMWNSNLSQCQGGSISSGVYAKNNDAKRRGVRSHWDTYQWAIGSDGKARRVEPSIRLLAHGIPNRVGRLRAYGNAIVPQVAAEIIGAYMDAVK